MFFFKKLREYCPTWALCILSFALLCVIINLIAVISAPFADWFNGSFGALARLVLAKLTGFVPFSLAETLIICSPLLLGLLIYFGFKKLRRSVKLGVRFVCGVMAVASILYSTFVFTFATAYRGVSLSDKLSVTRADVSAAELLSAAEYLRAETESLTGQIQYLSDGSSEMPYSYNELNSKLNEAFSAVCDQYPFIQKMNTRVKPVALSELMSYTHITGVYTYFSGEANVNVAFPDYTLPFTMAHEMAHQRGIAREDEANFIAFLVCTASNDSYIRYSGYLNLYEYVKNALYRADKQAYNTVGSDENARIISEHRAYSTFFSKYSGSTASKVSDAVNDAFLKEQGQAEGTRSYGLVVDLAVAYLKKDSLIE